jgi:glycosyltransferase involved in cell wall biosynthesis
MTARLGVEAAVNLVARPRGDDGDQVRTLPAYVLITPARNEEEFIEKTIESVIHQTFLPLKWVIVDDGSTDKTPEIVSRYLPQHFWMEMVQMPPHPDHSFFAKARCFNAGIERIKHLDFDVIGNVDADVSFEEDFLAFLLGQFAQDPDLGVAGAPMKEANHDAVEDGRFNETDVFGACQLFRRECFEGIGGYPRIRGGIDWAAVRMARMNGWKTRSFLAKRFFHHRVMGATNCSVWRATWNYGEKDYYLGNHPAWEMCRAVYQMTRKPFIVKGLILFAGYASACLRKMERPIPTDLIRFHRQEQLQRLISVLGLPILGRKLKQD